MARWRQIQLQVEGERTELEEVGALFRQTSRNVTQTVADKPELASFHLVATFSLSAACRFY